MAVDSSPCLPQKKVTPTSVLPIEAWYYNATDEPANCPHKFSPNREVSTEHLIAYWDIGSSGNPARTDLEGLKCIIKGALYSGTTNVKGLSTELGVLTWTQLEADNYQTNSFLNSIKKGRGYNYDEVLTVAPGKIPNFEANTKKFFTEHLHEQEEIRFILDGVGYEDIRDFDGQWIRIEIKKGDLIVLPPGMYHRFTLDAKNYLKALLLYQGQPCRTQFDQSPESDEMEVRQEYVDSVLRKQTPQSPMASNLEATTKSLEALTV